MSSKDPKSVAALIMGKIPPPGGAPSEDPAGPGASKEGGAGNDLGMDQDHAQELAAEDVFSAVQSGDKQLFLSSLKDLITMCMQKSESDEGY